MEELFAVVNGERVRVVRSGASVVLADFSDEDMPKVGRDAGGRTRVSQITTLGDYKILNSDRPLLIETVGTGSGSYGNSKYNMEVTGGQYLIRQTKKFHPYFSGKSQLVECTFDYFGLQTGTTKRVGYFSSTGTAPYTGNYDGIWLENDGQTFYLKASRAGTPTVSVPWTQWDSYESLQDYNWNNFTVIMFDFLWLGGAILNLWVKTNKGFILAHTLHYAGSSLDIFTQSPNQPVRYEIRGGTGRFRYVCSQVATEGSIEESGLTRFVYSGLTGTTLTNVNTAYPMKAVRKQIGSRDIAVAIEDLSLFVSSANDNLLWTLQVNPTLSAPLSYADVPNSGVQEATGNGVITVTSPGTIIAGGIITTNALIPVGSLKRNFLSYLGGTISNVMDEYVLCGTPITNSITSYGGINYKEY